MLGRSEGLRSSEPQLVAEVMLYRTQDGGRGSPALPGWGCPLTVTLEDPVRGWDAWPLLGDTPLCPGDRRRLGFVFLSGEGLSTVRAAGRFFLWEGRIVGEGTVVG